MKKLAQIFLDICLLRAGPQDLPKSTALLSVAITTYLIMNVIVSLSDAGFWNAFGLAILDMTLLAMFVQVALQTRGYESRFVQVLTALTGTGTLFGMLALPLVLVLHRNRETGSGLELSALLWLGLLVWGLLVVGHILRHALSTSLAVGLIWGFGYTVLSILLMQLIFPGSS